MPPEGAIFLAAAGKLFRLAGAGDGGRDGFRHLDPSPDAAGGEPEQWAERPKDEAERDERPAPKE